MKHILLFLLIYVFTSLSYITYAEDESKFEDLSCFSQVNLNYNFNNTSNKIYFESPEKNIQIIQDNKALDIKDIRSYLQYVAFESNIGDLKLSKNLFNNLYDFPPIDTKEGNDIELSVTGLVAGNFKINFLHDAQYHDAEYFMSDDGEQYYRIGKNDFNDFDVKKIKIVFTPNTNEIQREIINIQSLNIQRTNNILSVSNGNFTKQLDIYSGNICNTIIHNTDVASKSIIPLPPVSGGVTNYLYTQRITDSDNDGVKDLYDNCKFQSNSDQVDINQNSIGDACEFDNDSDGVSDEIDTCRNIANPGQEDDDRDGIGNLCDNCNLYNPAQIDINADGLGDVCEQKEQYILENDDDGDGVINSTDNCKDISNPDQLDSDSDGIGNLCDNCQSFQNRDQLDLNNNGVGDICEDSDNDGVDSLQDNCPNIPNPDQSDRDNDGVGNLCEDDDRDTILEIDDNCPLIYNPDQRDTDKDSLGDLCDENDDRLIESNRILFIGLLLFAITLFLTGIYMMSQKLKK